jgi:hypothetical protein
MSAETRDAGVGDPEPPDPLLSTDAAHSTYASVDPEPDNPPAGERVEQTLGYPTETAPQTSKTSTKSSSSSTSTGT